MLKSAIPVASGSPPNMSNGSSIAMSITRTRLRLAPGPARNPSDRDSKQAGFSAFELLAIVAIILIIAAIAVPNLLLRSRRIANEAAAVGSLRMINTECVTYSGIYHVGFPSTLAVLGSAGALSSTSAQLIDNVLASGAKSGYTFTYVAGAAADGVIRTYTLHASPITPGQTGLRYFYTNQLGIIRFNLSALATVSDAPVQ